MKSWVIGNWKLNPVSVEDVQSLVDNLVSGINSQEGRAENCQLMVAPSFVHLSTVQQSLQSKDSLIKLACQDVSALTDSYGAFTGDVSAEQLKDMGVEWVIIGHSERRQYYQEDNKVLLKKLQYSAIHNLGIILCIGETEADFNAGNTQQVLADQLAVIKDLLQYSKSGEDNVSMDNLADKLTQKLIVAYEPVWAIGTGKVPNVDEVTQVHAYIRQCLQAFDETLSHIPIIYGGSVKPDNAKEFAASEQINGVLVGGAALKADSFIDIAAAFIPL